MANRLSTWLSEVGNAVERFGNGKKEERSGSFGLTNIQGGIAELLGLDLTSFSVSAHSAMGISTFYACIRLISDVTASQPFNLYKSLKGGGSEKATEHNLNYLLHTRPNPKMSSFIFLTRMIANYRVYGFAIAEVVRDAKGNTVEIIPYASSKVTVLIDSVLDAVYFQVNGRILFEEDVIYLRDFGFDPIQGTSIVRTQCATIKLQGLVNKFSADYYQKGTFMAGFLSTRLDPKNQEIAKLYKENIIEAMKGSNTGGMGIAVLGDGVQWHNVSRAPVESQVVEFLNRGDKEIAKFFLIPPVMLGDGEKQTSFGTGIASQYIHLTNNVLIPIAIQIEQEVNYKCLSFRDQKTGYYTKINFMNLLRGDASAYADFVGKMVDKGIYSQDEVRAWNEMAPLENNTGSEHWIQQNMMPLSSANKILEGKYNGTGNSVPSSGD